MSEIYINIMAILVIFVVAGVIRTKYADRVSVNVKKGIYVIAIAYFLFIMIYYFNNSTDNTRRIVQILLEACLIGYFIYRIKALSNKTSH
jgi:MFS-type transporter involved in bile tolerance (Atg22 family)